MKKSLQVFVLIAIVVGSLIYIRRTPFEHAHYQGELWADQAGYYMYLPANFIYGWDGTKISPEIIANTGKGFSVDSVTGIIETKYAIGVAILQMPFFALVHFYVDMTGGVTDGFSGAYHNVPNIASWFYATLGLWFFFLLLLRRVRLMTAAIVLSAVFFGTNVMFYTIDDTGMSHVYSFFLFSIFLWVIDGIINRFKQSGGSLLLAGIIGGLIVAVRPLNALFIPLATFFLLWEGRKHIGLWFLSLRGKEIGLGLCGFFLMVVPQLLYWKYSSGNFIHYSYGEEGFSNWNNPWILAFWFAPNAGMFLYTPMWAAVIMALITNIRLRQNQLLALFFLLLSYILSSWWVYSFGCSFGSRNFVEYTVIFFIPLALWIDKSKKTWRKWLLSFMLLCGLYNVKMTYTFDFCFRHAPWHWESFMDFVERGGFYKTRGSTTALPDKEFIEVGTTAHSYFTFSRFNTAEVHLKIDGYSDKTILVLEVFADSSLQFHSINVAEEAKKDRPHYIQHRFLLIDDYPSDAIIKTYVWNRGKDTLHIEQLAMWLK